MDDGRHPIGSDASSIFDDGPSAVDILRADLNLGDVTLTTALPQPKESSPMGSSPVGAARSPMIETGSSSPASMEENAVPDARVSNAGGGSSLLREKKRDRQEVEMDDAEADGDSFDGSDDSESSGLEIVDHNGLAVEDHVDRKTSDNLIDLSTDIGEADAGNKIYDRHIQDDSDGDQTAKRPRYSVDPSTTEHPRSAQQPGSQSSMVGPTASFRKGLEIPAFRRKPSAKSSPMAVDLAGDDTTSSSDLDGFEVGSGSESASEDDGYNDNEDSGFIPFLKPSAVKPKTTGSSGGKSAGGFNSTGGPRLRAGATSVSSGGNASTAREHEQVPLSLASRLWPSASRFYRAVLRWQFCPDLLTITEDKQSAAKMELTAVPTEFQGVVDYQTVLSRLVLKETIASLQQGLSEKSYQATLVDVAGEVVSTCFVDKSTWSGSKEGKLYSMQVQLLDLPKPPPNSKDREPQSPFSGGELVGIRCTQWPNQSLATALGVVQSWDPVYDKSSQRKHGKAGTVFIRVLVCACSTGGDGVGASGGWIPLASIQACSGGGAADSGSKRGLPVSFVSVGSVMTASREFQAVMSVSDFPEHLRRCLIDPSVSKEVRTTKATLAPSSSLSSSSSCSSSNPSSAPKRTYIGFGGKGTDATPGSASGGGKGDDEFESPPENVSPGLWKALVGAFNRSQVLAIRKVAKGSAAGFTLLQGPPGTGKTRTIMGIVGVLLAGGCPYPTSHRTGPNTGVKSTSKQGAGASIVIGSSLSGNSKSNGKRSKKAAKGNQNGDVGGARIHDPAESRRVRVLIVAPSNAAVDELVLRLCQEGVPGANGRSYFPKVVRVGAPRGDKEEEAGSAARGGGSRESLRVASSPEVQAVSLERLAEERKKTLKGNIQWNRLDILLQADVVCATLSGSGSQPLVEAMLLSSETSGKKKSKSVKKRLNAIASSNGGNTALEFDAVVMDEAAQAVEPSSLIPLRFNPRAVVLVGDPAQLPATIFSREAENANYGQSLFQRLQRGGHPKMMLDTQYRMHPSIASFASSRFYNGLLRSSPTVNEQSHGQPFHRLPRFAPYLFHNVTLGRLKRGGGAGAGSSSVSLANMEEVYYITALLNDLVKSCPEMNFNGRVGVIAPYRNQIQALKRAMWSTGLRQDGVEISTVDGFQGREKDIMIFSCVRAPEEGLQPNACGVKGGVGFLDDWRRLNVAITRAKYAMWIVGHAGVLKQSKEWRELINDSKQRKAFIDRSIGRADGSATTVADPDSRGQRGLPVARYSGSRGNHRGRVAHAGPPRGMPASYPHVPRGAQTTTHGTEHNRYPPEQDPQGSGRGLAYTRLGVPPSLAPFLREPYLGANHGTWGRGSIAQKQSSMMLHDLPIARPCTRVRTASQEPHPGFRVGSTQGTDNARQIVRGEVHDRYRGNGDAAGHRGQSGDAARGLLDGLPIAPPSASRTFEK